MGTRAGGVGRLSDDDDVELEETEPDPEPDGCCEGGAEVRLRDFLGIVG